MKEFNTTAVCIPSKHYMVDISERVAEIKKMVDAGKYFTINRGRQYGKTTTIEALCQKLKSEYVVRSLDFQDISESAFRTEGAFVKSLSRILCDARDFMDVDLPKQYYEEFRNLTQRESDQEGLYEWFRICRKWCMESDFPIVLIIDEVDSATNNQVFLDFLAQLRSWYIKREKNPGIKTFHSVILAGVTDIKHLKTKIREDGEHRVNSPWNIAADFNIDMSLSEEGIRGMLDEYEADHHTGMDTAAMAKLLREYTSGYPFLVSRLCQLMDLQVSKTTGLSEAWTKNGFEEAVRLLLAENNTLFQSLTKNLNNYPQLKDSLRSILMEGTRIAYNVHQDAIAQLEMYGLIRNDQNSIRISNRIFETMLYNLFLSDEEMKSNSFYKNGELARNQFVEDRKLNMRLILERFIVTYTEVCGPLKERFREKDGREQFLLYLKPIINGTGNFYIEAQTRDQTRTDVIVDYLGQQYIIELKIWRGDRYNAKGEQQILDYLDHFHLQTGYMLSFNFNQKKEVGVKRVEIGDKVLYEGML